MTKEEAYDAKLYPLVKQIIEICDEHEIEHLLHFYIGDPDDDTLRCTTSKAYPPEAKHDDHRRALGMIYQPIPLIAITIITKEPQT